LMLKLHDGDGACWSMRNCCPPAEIAPVLTEPEFEATAKFTFPVSFGRTETVFTMVQKLPGSRVIQAES
jgi:hypothetical protein